MNTPKQDRSLPPILNERTTPLIEQMMSGMPGGFFVYHADKDESLIYANNALVRIYGCRDLEEFKAHTGFTFRGMVHPDDREWVSASIVRQIADSSDDLDHVEYRILRRDGSVRWLNDYGHFVHSDAYGDLFYVFVEDSTERHRQQQLVQDRLHALEKLEHETTSLRLVHEMLGSGMWSMEFDGQGAMRSVSWSDQFRRMLGYRDAEDFPDHLESWSDLLHPEDRERVLSEYYATINDYTGQKTYDEEYRMLTRDRGYRWYRATGRLSRRADGTPITYVGMFVDITVQKRMDQELRDQRRLLEEALAQAQHSSRAKTAFLNNMSHDIRTPMNAIIGFTSLASAHTDSPELVRDYLGKIMAAGNHLLALINDVLDMSRIESGKMQLEEKACSLSDVMSDLRAIVQTEVRAKQIEFRDAMDIADEHVICDKLRLNQVLLNVVGNALKFTPPHGAVSVRAAQKGPAPAGYASYEFTVRDTGIGMSAAFLEHIFEPFERERTSTASGVQGTGLGLAITKNIVDMMNGTITVDSEVGKGTVFTIAFTFRLAGQPQQAQPPAPQPEAAPAGRRVLITEDNELNQEIAATILTEAGFEVDVACDGSVAVEKISASPPGTYDLVLMDIQMPVMDGYEAARTIKAMDDPAKAAIPIVAVSANVFDEDRSRALASGMSAYLSKPIDVGKLLDTLGELLD